MTLHALASTGRPSLHPVASASAALERAWHAVNAAQDAFVATPLGDTDDLFARSGAWVLAIDEYERARAVLAEALRRRDGRSGLRCIRGGRP